MHLTGIQLGNVPPFTDPITLRFDERVNVFIGPNASGKSTILTVLAASINDDPDSERSLDDARAAFLTAKEFEEAVVPPSGDAGGANNNIVGVSEWDFVNGAKDPWSLPAIRIGSVREGLSDVNQQAPPEEFGDWVADVLIEPFDGTRTMCAYELLLKEIQGGGSNLQIESPGAALGELLRAVELADSCSRQICGEVVRDSDPHNYIPGLDPRGYFAHPAADPNRITVLRLLGVNTNDVRNFDALDLYSRPATSAYREHGDNIPIYLGHASSGTQGSILWARWIALSLVFYNSFQESWEEQPAILLIDEIENHLHPTWQRRVIPALLEHFPGLQIFATTHSPFVVAGLKAGQVHVLKRDANGVVTASTNEQDVVGWTMDEVLRTLMGVEDPTDDATAAAARELRKLRQEGPRASEKEEEERQQRIQELRQKVDRDLLAGGPMQAQRELFEQQFAEALENYRRAQDLEQENH